MTIQKEGDRNPDTDRCLTFCSIGSMFCEGRGVYVGSAWCKEDCPNYVAHSTTKLHVKVTCKNEQPVKPTKEAEVWSISVISHDRRLGVEDNAAKIQARQVAFYGPKVKVKKYQSMQCVAKLNEKWKIYSSINAGFIALGTSRNGHRSKLLSVNGRVRMASGAVLYSLETAVKLGAVVMVDGKAVLVDKKKGELND